MDLRRKGHGSQSTMSRCVKAATKLRLEHASPRLSEQGCGEQKKCRKGPARDSPRISAYPTAGKTNSPRLIPAASNPLPPTSSYSDQKKSPPKDFCPLTNPQPYQRERNKPRRSNGAVGFMTSCCPAVTMSHCLVRWLACLARRKFVRKELVNLDDFEAALDKLSPSSNDDAG